MYTFKNGWYELPHNPNNKHKKWLPRLQWCRENLEPGKWKMQDVMYEYGKELKEISPLTWLFKSKEDLLLFLLRWPDIDDE